MRTKESNGCATGIDGGLGGARQGRMPSRTTLVVDADGHVCEPPDLWEKGLATRDRDRALRLRWNVETGYDEAWVEDWCVTDRGLVGLGNAGTPFIALGKGRRYVDGDPAGFDPTRRVEVLDAEGIDVAVLYGDRKSTRLNSSHIQKSRMPSSA